MKNAEYVWRQEKDPAVGEAGTYLETVVSTPSSRYYVHKGLRFVFDNERGDFFTHAYPVDGVTFHDIRNLAKEEQAAHFQPREARMSVYGPNEMHVPVPSIPELLVEELLHPFYVFQVWVIIERGGASLFLDSNMSLRYLVLRFGCCKSIGSTQRQSSFLQQQDLFLE